MGEGMKTEIHLPREKTAFEKLSNREQDSIRALVSGYAKGERTMESAINFAEKANFYTPSGRRELQRQLGEVATKETEEGVGKLFQAAEKKPDAGNI
jgi:hypothetical protein